VTGKQNEISLPYRVHALLNVVEKVNNVLYIFTSLMELQNIGHPKFHADMDFFTTDNSCSKLLLMVMSGYCNKFWRSTCINAAKI